MARNHLPPGAIIGKCVVQRMPGGKIRRQFMGQRGGRVGHEFVIPVVDRRDAGAGIGREPYCFQKNVRSWL